MDNGLRVMGMVSAWIMGYGAKGRKLLAWSMSVTGIPAPLLVFSPRFLRRPVMFCRDGQPHGSAARWGQRWGFGRCFVTSVKEVEEACIEQHGMRARRDGHWMSALMTAAVCCV
ncbi:uncharacterized protein BDZ99DRAFT_107950 [Mytilinidion resinicola]|uniref:Uncharacterized protein n=1 Tax=Mytilinidion resinicola TaxID=574789 RepID=A0A6A6YAT3_9PEZI|nr:uncharacterized protein BDZ99DRAFT_107950 [Mytilinidion resinicola]KAF2805613.1 hypothetical protein BDZ99DRAFT_107950 [Mytilinidion resinicola]